MNLDTEARQLNPLIPAARHELEALSLDVSQREAAAISPAERIELLKRVLPEQHEPYADKYFLRTGEILRQEGLNPWVKAQVFVRKGPGTIHGIEEALAIIDKYSDLKAQGGKVWALSEGDRYEAGDTVMVIEGPLQSIVELETMYLGVIAAETTRANDQVDVSPETVGKNMREVVSAADGRPVMYFGARHWRYDCDAAFALAAHEAGADSTSSDIGAATFNAQGIGTIPHVLENAYALLYGKERAVVEATLAFDRVIDPAVPRIALIDYNNRELDDSLAVARALGGRLHAVRVDTCGENVMQGALTCPEDADWDPFWSGVPLPAGDDPAAKYWYGNGVTISGVYALRRALDEAGFGSTKIILSSGFGDVEKVRAFVEAEKALGVKLFDSLGVGSVVRPARYSTMDVVAAGSGPTNLQELSKVGRRFKPNPRLELAPGYDEEGQ